MHFPRRSFLLATGALAVSRAGHAQGVTHVLVVGDSQAQGLAGGFMRQYRRDRSMQIDDRSRIATGLLWPNRFNWPDEITGIADAAKGAAIAFVMFGANDRPPIRPHGDIDPKLAATFRDSYSAKVHTIDTALKRDFGTVVWVGHPIVRDADYAQDMTLLNDVYAEQAAAAGVDWFPSWGMFTDSDGGYDAYGKALDGQTARLRADDGVHLTPAGYDVLAHALMPFIADASKSEGAPA